MQKTSRFSDNEKTETAPAAVFLFAGTKVLSACRSFKMPLIKGWIMMKRTSVVQLR